jgi:hypothetical protein
MRKLLLHIALIACTLSAGLSCIKDPTTPPVPTQEDIVVIAMITGKWFVKSFTLNGTDITTDFSAYEFQYYSNRTVDAIKNNTTREAGTWDGNSSTMTTSANFPNAVNPLARINGSWKIDRNGWSFVEATQTIGSETKKMRLERR